MTEQKNMHFNSDDDSRIDFVYKIVKNTYGDTFRFYKNKGFRKYDVKSGSWIFMADQDVRKLVWDCIDECVEIGPKTKTVIQGTNFWNIFSKWFKNYDKTDYSSKNHYLVGFKNCTLNLQNLTLQERSPDSHCFQSIKTDYSYSFLNKGSYSFFQDIASNDILTLNILRSILKMAILGNKIDNQKVEIIFFFGGIPGNLKPIFLRYLKFLTRGNSADLDLFSWAKNVGKLEEYGISHYFFQNVDYSGLTKSSVREIKKVCFNTRGPQIFISGSDQLIPSKPFFLRVDNDWKQKVLFLPIPKEGETFKKNKISPDRIYSHLVNNTSGIIAWSLAISNDCLLEISNSGSIISEYLKKNKSDDNIDSLAVDFFLYRVNIDSSRSMSAGHNFDEKMDYLQNSFIKFCKEYDYIIPKGRFTIKNAFSRALSTFDLQDKVIYKRKAGGFIYQGVSLVTHSGEGLKSNVPKVIKLLQDTPILTAVGKNFEITTFEIEKK